jgi:hypothetical protein
VKYALYTNETNVRLPMYASIQRHRTGTTPIDDLATLSWGLTVVLARCPGFIAAVAVADGRGELCTIGLFEDRASMGSAIPTVERWMAEHFSDLQPDHIRLMTGEVVAQKGI